MWEVSSGYCKRTFAHHDEWVRSIALNSKGNLLASASDDETLLVWEVDSGKVSYELNGHENKIECVRFVLAEENINLQSRTNIEAELVLN